MDRPGEDRPVLDAGGFAQWVAALFAALTTDAESDVPCGTCTACCTSSQFVHIAPDEVDTLARIPSQLLFSAPMRPTGHMVMGYDERGHCPMFVDNTCSIYAARPRTCRVYDCRVFTASGITDDDPNRAAIDAQARRWRFDYRTSDDRNRQDAVRAAAAYIDRIGQRLDAFAVPSNPTQRAVLAVEIHHAFMAGDGPNNHDEVAVNAALRQALGSLRPPNSPPP